MPIEGAVQDAATKDKIWGIYGKLDPCFRDGAVYLNGAVAVNSGDKTKVINDSNQSKHQESPRH